jgi:signal transduction histidine kinase
MPQEEKVNILLVDDRPENLVALEAVLDGLGQNLVKATSGKEALKRLLSDDFALILMDVQMPEMDGFETARLIRERERTQHTPILFITAIHKTEAHASIGYSVGGVDYIFKPFNPDALRAKVQSFVDVSKRSHQQQAEIRARRQSEREARKLNQELERRVAARTAALEAANRALESEIAERRQLEETLRKRAHELADLDRRKDEFLAMLAHELRNPLVPILNAVELIQLRGNLDPDVQRARDIISRQAGQMARLVDDLLESSRITRGKIELRMEQVDLARIAEHAVETVRPLLSAAEHVLCVSLPRKPLRMVGDPLRLEQVIVNLLNNAAKFTDPGGSIWLEVGTERQGDRAAERTPGEPSPHPSAVIRVRDTGAGIAPDALPHVFAEFTRAPSTGSQAASGLGLGLALVRRLAQLHGGCVDAHSPGLGRGSEFVVRLPIRMAKDERRKPNGRSRDISRGAAQPASPGAQPPTPTPQSPGSPPPRVLVVDDNVDAAETLADLLKLWGYDVSVAHDGSAGLAAAAACQPDLVLLDIGLPEMDGYQVARRLRAELGPEKAKIVALTGYGYKQDRRRSRQAGFHYHLTKPVDPQALREFIDRLPTG